MSNLRVEITWTRRCIVLKAIFASIEAELVKVLLYYAL
jgi:hypothetical protein